MTREYKDYAYADWFGSGNTAKDIHEAMAEHGHPHKVFIDRNMAALVYDEKVVVVGYDGNEYTHTFVCNEPFPPKPSTGADNE